MRCVIGVELKGLTAQGIEHKYDAARKTVFLQKGPFKVYIDLGVNHFPFVAPKIVLDVKAAMADHLSQFDIRQATFEDIMKEHWHPSIRLADIAEKSLTFCERSLMPADKIKSSFLRWLQGMVGQYESGSTRKDPLFKVLLLVLLVKLTLAVVLSLGPIDP